MCSFQGTNCDNHSIMVIYGLKWTFPSDWRLSFSFTLWAQVDSNHRPHAYQACALTSWAISPLKSFDLFGVFNYLSITEQYNQFPYLFLFLRKEVIQPHLPIRLPCYDFTPVTSPAFGSSLLSVESLTSGITDSHGVTGGVYKTRERIHRSILICDY